MKKKDSHVWSLLSPHHLNSALHQELLIEFPIVVRGIDRNNISYFFKFLLKVKIMKLVVLN